MKQRLTAKGVAKVLKAAFREACDDEVKANEALMDLSETLMEATMCFDEQKDDPRVAASTRADAWHLFEWCGELSEELDVDAEGADLG